MLETLANLAELIGGAAVLGGVVFAVWQIRQYRHQRRDATAIEIVRTIQSREFVEAFRLLSRVPDGISLEALRAKGPEYEDAATTLGAIGETIGLMVYRGIAPFELVQEQVGGLLLTMWQKLRVWAEQVREDQGYERWVEWYQWLVDRLEEYEQSSGITEPAYRRLPEWKPRR